MLGRKLTYLRAVSFLPQRKLTYLRADKCLPKRELTHGRELTYVTSGDAGAKRNGRVTERSNQHPPLPTPKPKSEQSAAKCKKP